VGRDPHALGDINRIPSRKNPAYAESCEESGIDPEETDPIILLPTIGKRGASSFVFEKPRVGDSALLEEVAGFRRRLNLTLREFSAAFGISTATLQKIEAGSPNANEAVRRLRIYTRFPEVALWEVEMNKPKLHWKTYEKLKQTLEQRLQGSGNAAP
jgi:DNA-binding transcriptional regulator YiaG